MPHHTPRLLERFSSGFDDSFSDVVSAFDNTTKVDHQDCEVPSIDRDNKLLSFSQPRFEYVLMDYTYRQTTISLSAQLHGMFFMAESPWATTAESTAPPLTELTCYRRNLFQITGNITLPRTLRYILTDQGKQIPILSQELVISATESTEGNPVRVISVPWKTPAVSTVAAADDKMEREPPAIALDLMNVQDLDSDFATFPFSWKRLQFRIATANNGRRKELQQHFVVRLKIMATVSTGSKICICEVQSGAIIVRGRSPRNFQSRKDTPLNGGGNSHLRKTSHLTPQITRTSTGESLRKQPNNEPTSHPNAELVKNEAPPPPMSVQSFFDPHDLQMAPEFYDGLLADPVHQVAMTALPAEPVSFDASRGYAASSPNFSRFARPYPPVSAPINLSLDDDEPQNLPRAPGPIAYGAKKVNVAPRMRPPSFSLNAISGPDESADLLYEYFPLGLDDWMPPVDAVYRPHVVHHTNLPTDPRDLKGTPRSGRSKRYFSEDMG